MALSVCLCIVGFLLLYYGAEWLVRGSASLARSLGVTPIVVGLTVVAFGTSAPELVVSLASAIRGKSMIAVGNVVGSNICNIALVLGLAAVFHPITCQRSVLRREIPLMLGISLAFLGLCADSELSRADGALLFGGILAYTFANVRKARRQSEAEEEVPAAGTVDYTASRPRQLALILVGIGGVVGGAELVVGSAVKIMSALGVGPKFIGLTVVAFGTSLPELATSVVAAIRREMDISIGNLVGSNVFNLLSVLGAASLFRPIPIPGGFVESGLVVDCAVMFATSSLPLALMWRKRTLRRSGGVVLLATYAVYLTWLVLRA